MMEHNRIIPNYLGNYRESMKLARKIRKYWNDKGYEVNVYVEKFSLGLNSKEYFQIRSNINLEGMKTHDK